MITRVISAFVITCSAGFGCVWADSPVHKTMSLDSKLGVLYGGASMQGRRPYMEDVSVMPTSLPQRPGAIYVGIFDGHGGAPAAEYAAQHLHTLIPVHEPLTAKVWHSVFAQCDEQMKTYDRCGTCVVAACIEDNQLSSAWAGDCTLLHVRDGQVIYQTPPHNFTYAGEYDRVVAAGAVVWREYVCHPYEDQGVKRYGLNMTRSLGDQILKEGYEAPLLLHIPDVYQAPLQDGDVIIMYTDGLTENGNAAYTDLQSAQRIADIVGEKISTERLAAIAHDLCTRAFDADRGNSDDNISVIILQVHIKGAS